MNLDRMERGRRPGEATGPYERFFAVAATAVGDGALKLDAMSIKASTSVAESCGAGRRQCPGAELKADAYVAQPPILLAHRNLKGENGTTKFGADRRLIIQMELSNAWKWSCTPTAKKAAERKSASARSFPTDFPHRRPMV